MAGKAILAFEIASASHLGHKLRAAANSGLKAFSLAMTNSGLMFSTKQVNYFACVHSAKLNKGNKNGPN